MSHFWLRFWGALRRVIPGCIAQTQAIAFNMFLALFPIMLLVLGLAASSTHLRSGLLAVIGHLRLVLPPGALRIFETYLSRSGSYPWQWISLGMGGTLLAGTQMMRLTIDGFWMVYRTGRKPSFWSQNLRALLLLLTTIAPWLLTADLIVFGKQIRNWMMQRTYEPALISALWAILYVGVSLVLAMIVLSMIYRIGRPAVVSWIAVLPGAALATILWWFVSAALGLYIRRVPYNAVYGEVAVVIGMMLWMQLTATILLIGAAFNAEFGDSPARGRPGD